MSSSGVGRGRGWLNLSKSQNVTVVPPRPGSSPTSINPLSPNLALIDDAQFADKSNEFTDLISIVKQLNLNDDGIKFNQKKKHILESWKESCQTSEDVERCFDAIHQACLSDADLGSKLVYMISARSFISQEIHDQNIRLMFLRKLQNNFEGCKLLQKTNPVAFRNSVQMLGEFYHKARLANGQQLTFMATPFMTYLEMLLESTQSLDLKLFTAQLYLNGASIKNESPDKIIEILNKVRLLLASEKQLTRECKLWLLLALDIANSKFAILPAEVYTFYHDQLGEAAMVTFQGVHGTLSVQTTHTSATLDSFQSSVNVLQLSTPLDTANNQVSPSSNTQPDLNSTSFGSSGFASDSSHSSTANRDTNSHGGKHGRPILGSGARFNKNRSNDESNSNWRERDQSGGWGGRQKTQGGRGDSRKNTKAGKGWEHDDRFENDYS
ncbi:uncharacterized protein LOC108917725 [Anoplophora glabripennis]|uniref:uncharacterized protein LOC108917725 n=1 Tax=Anoplophora glabripennis TaxID=217634 RepID=UPI000873ECD1|nr:uncharacterized protein LOC108917725 [Anoplophora glabripennis]